LRKRESESGLYGEDIVTLHFSHLIFALKQSDLSSWHKYLSPAEYNAMKNLPHISLSFFLLLPCLFQSLWMDPPKNRSFTSPDSTTILKELSLSAENLKTKTGIYTLENGGMSLIARLWLFTQAKQTIDIQYYSFAKDVTGLIASDYMVRAAERGVKVRLLVDDAASKMYSYEIQMLDSHENIEVRVYNAGLMLGTPLRRIKNTFANYNRLLRRMHNKTLNIDNQACIMGGRNIADEYFDYDHRYNFRDRDVLILGHHVDEVKKSFDAFWNSDLTVTYEELSGRHEDKNPARFARLHKAADESKEFPLSLREKVKKFPEELKAADRSGNLLWVKQFSFISDKPGKNEDKKKREGGICVDSMIQLFKNAKRSIVIQSPYFIITEDSKKLIEETIQRGVKIKLLTNSMSSTDNFEAFSGYQRDREKILGTGINVYEFKPDSKVRFKLMIPEVQEMLNYKPVYGLHSKTIILDDYITVIGSYNFDPRSANYNSECFCVIRSTDVAKHVSKYIEEEFLPENAWQISTDFNPDSKAKLKKRLKVLSRRIIPKKLV
jgi:cardiolipin synthase C